MGVDPFMWHIACQLGKHEIYPVAIKDKTWFLFTEDTIIFPLHIRFFHCTHNDNLKAQKNIREKRKVFFKDFS